MIATLIWAVSLSLQLRSNTFPLIFQENFYHLIFHFLVSLPLSVSFVISLYVDIWTLYAQSAKAINIHPRRMRLLLD